MKRCLSVFLALVILVAAFAGCSAAKSSEKNRVETSSPSDSDQQKPEANQEEAKKEDNSQGENIPSYKAVLYFHDKEAMSVVKEEREIKTQADQLDVTQKAKMCIDELIKGSANGLSTSIPPTTKVMSIKMDKDIMIVDLSKEFETDHNGGSAGILMTMSQLVLTLTELEGVKEVSFKIAGRTQEDFKGHIEFNKSFTRDEFKQYIKN
ncbi:MAG: GerMN domain-containing protein [Clostridia bacterium]|nr:GerMN domain-containing protein [Clostridia bacterium]